MNVKNVKFIPDSMEFEEIVACAHCEIDFEYVPLEGAGRRRSVCDACRREKQNQYQLFYSHRNLREEKKPLKRLDCVGSPRPCPWISCRNHMLWILVPGFRLEDVEKTISQFIGKHTNDEILKKVEGLKESCTLDMCHIEGMTLEEVGAVMGITRERVRQIEHYKGGGAIQRLRHPSRLKMIEGFRGMEDMEKSAV